MFSIYSGKLLKNYRFFFVRFFRPVDGTVWMAGGVAASLAEAAAADLNT